jgi:hypothetical protein
MQVRFWSYPQGHSFKPDILNTPWNLLAHQYYLKNAKAEKNLLF